MPILTPDTTDMVGVIDPGTYQATIVEADAQTSKKGNPMVVPTFNFQVNGKERSLKSFIVVTGPGSFNFDQLLRAIGQTQLADKYKAGEKIPFDTDTLKGQSVNIVIDTELREGREQNAIKGYLRA